MKTAPMPMDFRKTREPKKPLLERRGVFVLGTGLGLVLGLGVAVGVHLYYQQLLHNDAPVMNAAEKPADPGISGLGYGFFNMLPEFEIFVPNPEDKTQAAENTMRYILQAGAFGTVGGAETQRTRLANMGYKAHVQPVERGNKKWHRVWLGPYIKMPKADAVRRELKSRGIETLLTERPAN